MKFSDEPHFDLGNITTTVTNNVTVIGVVGRSVQLKCKVQNLGNKTVIGYFTNRENESMEFSLV